MNRLGNESRAVWVLGGFVAVMGCQGTVESPSREGPSDGQTGLDEPSEPVAPSAGGGGEEFADGLPDHRTSPGLRALHPTEYVNAIEAVLGVRLSREGVPPPTVVQGHGHIAGAQAMGYGEVDAFYALGRDAAARAVDALEPSCRSDAACVRSFAEAFLARTARGEDDTERYLAMLSESQAGETADERLVSLIATTLSSPHFLYRWELGEGQDPSHRVLTAEELAERLSYLVWAGPPDEVLKEADLFDPEQRRGQLTRMLEDPRSRSGLRAFVVDWMGLYQGGVETKAARVLEGTSPELASDVARSFERIVDDVLFEGSGTFTALLSTDRIYADRGIAELVGLSTDADALAPMTVDVSERRGILTHPAVVAAHSKESGASPFNIGKFIYEHILCEVIGSPPVTPAIDNSETGGETLRQRLEAATSGPGCVECHSKIGPPGFAFLGFDPLGRLSQADPRGRPYDTQGRIPIGSRWLEFETASELTQMLSEEPQVAECIAKRLFRWTFGRFEAQEDARFLAELQAVSVRTQADMTALFEFLVTSEAFTRVRRGS